MIFILEHSKSFVHTREKNAARHLTTFSAEEIQRPSQTVDKSGNTQCSHTHRISGVPCAKKKKKWKPPAGSHEKQTGRGGRASVGQRGRRGGSGPLSSAAGCDKVFPERVWWRRRWCVRPQPTPGALVTCTTPAGWLHREMRKNTKLKTAQLKKNKEAILFSLFLFWLFFSYLCWFHFPRNGHKLIDTKVFGRVLVTCPSNKFNIQVKKYLHIMTSFSGLTLWLFLREACWDQGWLTWAMRPFVLTQWPANSEQTELLVHDRAQTDEPIQCSKYVGILALFKTLLLPVVNAHQHCSKIKREE